MRRIVIVVILAAIVTGAMPAYAADCKKALFGWTANDGRHVSGTLANEGGWVNNPADTGGETYKGKARKFDPKWKGWAKVDAAKKQIRAQPKFGTQAYYRYARTLNKALAADSELQDMIVGFYHDTIWAEIHGDEIKSQYLAYKLFDLATNMGTGTAIILLEKTMNDLNGKAPDWPIKSRMTSEMVAWLNDFTAPEVLVNGNESNWRRWCFLDHLKLEAMERYGNLIAKNAKLAQFWATWRDRAENDA